MNGKAQKLPGSAAVFAVTLLGSVVIQSALAQTAQTDKPAVGQTTTKEVKFISEDEAKQIAEKKVPGKAVDVAIEKKRGANRYVVEVRPASGGKELDVIIDMVSGKVLAVEK
jgi:uncharacterized membrane protein YkoI